MPPQHDLATSSTARVAQAKSSASSDWWASGSRRWASKPAEIRIRSGAKASSAGTVQNFVEAAESAGLELHAFTLLRRGHLIAQGAWAPFTLDQPHALFSVSKSFTSTAVGLAVGEGLLSLDDPVLSFFPEFRPEVVSGHLAAMRVRDLLTMTSGHQGDVTGALYEGQPHPGRRLF